MISNELRVLFGKEWKQVVRNRGAVLTATLFPLLFLLVMPVGQSYLISQGLTNMPTDGAGLPPGLAGASPAEMFVQFTFPLFLVMGGLVVPAMAASYTIVSEREKRTVDLLLALPVSLGQIVAAKVGAVLVLALAITLPLALVDFVYFAAVGLAGPALLAAYGFELVASLTFSTASAVVVALLARDYRTANNLTGAFMGPAIVLTLAFNVFLPWGLYRLLLHGALLLALGLGSLAVGLRVVSLERYAL